MQLLPVNSPLLLDPHEERAIFSKVIEDIKARSGSKDKIMVYLFQEYFSFPVNSMLTLVLVECAPS